MYLPDTILVLKDQREPHAETGEEFPYNRVKVVLKSPILHDGPYVTLDNGQRVPKYQGDDAVGVIVQPVANFGANLDEPFGKLRKLYDVEFEPDPAEIVVGEVRIPVRNATVGVTPEDIFKEKAPGKASEAGERVRTPISPLDDPEPESTSPLGDA